ncbi:hypothetical protein MIMGU_mgv1a003209mg [Erythranthe guttata]|uniref:Uncharacterized protein n=1 Tax=Erythranthe guttata TaxID=4155 RepID=A0A022PYL1_ERYGU|nr:hypothetical protein MIMGU_mgv1a003209mg [Erythranthe guttata]
MAKKKVSQSHQEKPLQKQDDSVKAAANQEVSPPMDSEASEKLESLKSLNQILVKESFERRQQVESLVQSKASLESELTRSNSDKEGLMSELTRLGETAAALELERSVVAVFVAEQVAQNGEVFEREVKGLESELKGLRGVIGEKESEIGSLTEKLSEIEGELGNERAVLKGVCVERDEIKGKLDLQIDESKGLKANLIEFEEKNRVMERAIGELRSTYNAVLGEKEEREMRIESILREKDSIERSLVESNKLAENLKEELSGVVREKEGIEEEKNAEIIKRQELENADMVREITQLVEEKKSSEERIEGLTDEKTAIGKDLKEALEQLAEQKLKIEEMVNEKIVVLEAKDTLDSEVRELQNQVLELKAVVSKLEENNRAEAEKIKNLDSEVGEYKSKLEEVKIKRDEMQKIIQEEKKNGVRLNEKITELENKVEESLKAYEELKAKNGSIFAEKVELESKCEKLKKGISSLENTIIEARNEFDSMKVKFESADANSELVMSMLKDTVAFCSKGEADVAAVDGVVIGNKNGGESKGCVVELEMIKNAFKSKMTKVETMKRQMELLQNSVEDAHKKKSFWTVLSSATTLLAAISLAYVARGH